MEKLKCPQDWHAISLNPKTKIYVNVKEQIFSLAPVIALDQLEMVVKDCLKLSYVLKDLQKNINQIT